MPCPQDAISAAIRGQSDLARTKVRAAIILTSCFCAFDTIPDPVYGFTAWPGIPHHIAGCYCSPVRQTGNVEAHTHHVTLFLQVVFKSIILAERKNPMGVSRP